jgi:hypothetical protein
MTFAVNPQPVPQPLWQTSTHSGPVLSARERGVLDLMRAADEGDLERASLSWRSPAGNLTSVDITSFAADSAYPIEGLEQG